MGPQAITQLIAKALFVGAIFIDGAKLSGTMATQTLTLAMDQTSSR